MGILWWHTKISLLIWYATMLLTGFLRIRKQKG